MDSYTLEHTDVALVNVHSAVLCSGRPCTIHNRSDHHMRAFPQYFRSDAGFMERTCPHGIGHPDPDDPFAPPVHGCDGCCAVPEVTLTSFMAATDSYKP